MITRAMRQGNIIDRIINKIVDGKGLATFFLYSCLAVACVVCFQMLQSVYGTYIWWTATEEGQLTAVTNMEELYRNCWWGLLTILTNVICILLFLRVVFNQLKLLRVMQFSLYPSIANTGFLIKAFSNLYFITALWSLVSNNLQLLLKRQLVTISGPWQSLFPYHNITAFNDGQGNFTFSWDAFGSFNIEMIIYFLVVTIVLNFVSQVILFHYFHVIDRGTIIKEKETKNSISNNNKKSYTLDNINSLNNKSEV